MARDPGLGSPYAPDKPRAKKPYTPKPQPTLEPVGYTPAPNTPQQMRQITANVVANQAVKALQPDLAASRAAAPGPALTGYSALSALLGPDLAAHVPGTIAPKGAGKAVGVSHIGPIPLPGGVVGDAAMALPIIRGPRAAVRAAQALSKAERSAKAEAAVADAAKVARSQGYGRAGAPEVPRLKPGEVTPETGGQAGAQVRAGLKGAPEARAQQKELYRAERAKRFAKAEQALQSNGPRVIAPKYTPPEGALFHGSPEGELENIDALYHTKTWAEGTGFYVTASPEKAAKYAAGKTAKAERRSGVGALNVVKLKPGANVLDMESQPEEFWRKLAEDITGQTVDPETYHDFASLAHDARDSPHLKGASAGVKNRNGLFEYLSGYEDMPKTDAYYAIEDALHNAGYQATRHTENGVPVYIVKDANAIERLGSVKPEDALPQTAPADDPNAAFRQALRAFKGELPRIDYQGFKEFNQDAVDAMIRHIKDSPVLDVPSKVRAYKAIQNAVGGIVPTASEQRTLERVFGRETGQQIAKSAPLWKRIGRDALSVVNVPRTLQASFDLSFPLRQGLVAAAAHPRIWASELGPMVKMARSPHFYDEVQQAIREMPAYPLMEKARVSFTGFGESLADREEPFMSRLLQKVPGIGHGVRFSERGYVGVANKLRADLFNDAIHRAAENGVNINDPHELESIGKVINAFTGRGDLGKLQGAAPLLNTVFFSPRLFAARLNLIFGVGQHGIPGEFYMQLSPFARREALKGMRNLLGGLSTALALAKLNGASVNADPTNADFGKIRIGDTRIDLAAGFQQPIRLVAQLFSGHITSSTTGETLRLGPSGPGKLSRKDIAQRFFENKAAPVPAAINEALTQRGFAGQPVTLKSEAYSRLVPLLAQDVIDLYQQDGVLPAVGGATLGSFGLGVQTYTPKDTPARIPSAGPYSPSTSGSRSPYAPSSAGGGSPYGP